jgi:hypothetical protein
VTDTCPTAEDWIAYDDLLRRRIDVFESALSDWDRANPRTFRLGLLAIPDGSGIAEDEYRAKRRSAIAEVHAAFKRECIKTLAHGFLVQQSGYTRAIERLSGNQAPRYVDNPTRWWFDVHGRLAAAASWHAIFLRAAQADGHKVKRIFYMTRAEKEQIARKARELREAMDFRFRRPKSLTELYTSSSGRLVYPSEILDAIIRDVEADIASTPKGAREPKNDATARERECVAMLASGLSETVLERRSLHIVVADLCNAIGINLAAPNIRKVVRDTIS